MFSELLHLSRSLLHILGLHRISLLVRWHLIVHDLSWLRLHMGLPWRGHNSAIGDHGLYDVGSNLLCVLAGLAAVMAMAVDASPHEEREVNNQSEELAYNTCQRSVCACPFLRPKLVNISVLLFAVVESVVITVSRRVDIARVLFPYPRAVGGQKQTLLL